MQEQEDQEWLVALACGLADSDRKHPSPCAPLSDFTLFSDLFCTLHHSWWCCLFWYYFDSCFVSPLPVELATPWAGTCRLLHSYLIFLWP